MAEILIGDVTSGTLPGLGVFDELMTANQVRLDKQYDQNRLRGPDYAKVYLGSMEAIMAQSIQFLLGRQQADKQAELLDAQKDKTLEEILLVREQVKHTAADTELINAKIITESLQAELVAAQIRKMEYEIKLVLAQIDKMVLDSALVNVQIEKVKADILLVEAQIEKMLFERDLTQAQIWSERAKVSTDCSITVAPIAVGGLIKGQLDKLLADITLMKYKGITEQAQTDGVVHEGTTADPVQTGDIAGILGKQMRLYQKQTDGYDRDAEQKILKMHADVWNAQRMTDENLPVCETGFETTEIRRVNDKAKEGIGIPAVAVVPCPTPKAAAIQKASDAVEIAAAIDAINVPVPKTPPLKPTI